MGQPPPAPRLGPVWRPLADSPHRDPQPAPNPPAQPGAQPKYAVNIHPDIPVAPQAWKWRNGSLGAGNAVRGVQSPKEANGGNPPEAAASAGGKKPVDCRERILQLRGNFVKARQRAHPQPQPENVGAHAQAQAQQSQGVIQVPQGRARERHSELQRQVEQLQANQNRRLQNLHKIRRQPGQPHQ